MTSQIDKNIPAPRLEYLDAARGLAALTVIFSHFVNSYDLLPALNWTSYSIFHLWWDGFAAVSFFFVLSGYVLSKKYVQPRADGSLPSPVVPLRSFFITRIARIYFPYLAILLLSMALQILGARGSFDVPTVPAATDWIVRFWNEALTWKNIRHQGDLFTPHGDYNLLPQAWSLQVEIVISLFMPVLLLMVRQGISWLVFFGFLSFKGYGIMPNTFFFHFGLGIVLAMKEDALRIWWRSQNIWPKIAVLIAGFILYTGRFSIISYFGIKASDAVIWSITGLGSALLMIVILQSARTQRVLSRPLFTFLGKISYSIYLTHMIVLMCMLPFLFKLLARAGSTNLTLNWSLGLALLILGTIGLSTLSYHWVEKPCIRLGKAIDLRLTKVFNRQQPEAISKGLAGNFRTDINV